MPQLKYSLIFDELVDGPELDKLYAQSSEETAQLMQEVEEEEKNCGLRD